MKLPLAHSSHLYWGAPLIALLFVVQAFLYFPRIAQEADSYDAGGDSPIIAIGGTVLAFPFLIALLA